MVVRRRTKGSARPSSDATLSRSTDRHAHSKVPLRSARARSVLSDHRHSVLRKLSNLTFSSALTNSVPTLHRQNEKVHPPGLSPVPAHPRLVLRLVHLFLNPIPLRPLTAAPSVLPLVHAPDGLVVRPVPVGRTLGPGSKNQARQTGDDGRHLRLALGLGRSLGHVGRVRRSGGVGLERVSGQPFSTCSSVVPMLNGLKI